MADEAEERETSVGAEMNAGSFPKRKLSFEEASKLNENNVKEISSLGKQSSGLAHVESERKENAVLSSSSSPSKATGTQSKDILKKADGASLESRRYLWIFPPSQNACDVTITTPTGKRYFMKTSNERSLEDYSQKRKQRNPPMLLSKSVSDLLKEIDEERFKEGKEKEKEPEREVNSSGSERSLSHRDSAQLWVNKYAPRRFTELLSSEIINRSVLRWVKRWDPIVFGRRRTPGADRESEKEALRGGVFFDNKRSQGPSEQSKRSDFNRRSSAHASEGLRTAPLILLCGPPGMGKTTLAHVVARHAGYEPLEINASDERTKDSLLARVRASLEMKSLFGKSGRPRMPIIDEIDGAMGGSEGKSAIDALIKYVTGEGEKKKKKNVVGDGTTGNDEESTKGTSSSTPRRPIICICNNQFAPALRPLRKIAQIYVFERTHMDKLVSRLRFVCSREGLSASEKALGTMADLLQRDIRSCLHMLQFVHRQGKDASSSARRTLSEETLCAYAASAVVSSSHGGLASDTSIFESLRELFYGQDARSTIRIKNTIRRVLKGSEKSVFGASSSSWDQSASLLRLHGGRDGADFLRAIHENYLLVGLSDPTMKRTARIIDELATSMECHALANAKQQFSWLKYVPSAVCAVKRTFKLNARSFGSRRFVFGRDESKCYRAKRQRADILDAFISTAYATVGTRAPNVYVLDALSPFTSLLRPKLTSRGAENGSWRLLSSDDKRALRNVVDLMVSTGMTYRKSFSAQQNRFERQQFGQEYALEPKIETLTSFEFESSPPTHAKPLSNPMKKFLRHEIQSAIIRKRYEKEPKASRRVEVTPTKKTAGWRKYASSAKPTFGTPTKVENTPKPSANAENMPCPKASPNRPMNFLERAKALALKQKRKRLRGDNSKKKTEDSNSNQLKSMKSPAKKAKPSVIFRFQEGFSNAVRRPVSIYEFIELHGQWKRTGVSRLE